jgi:hypothetical protein
MRFVTEAAGDITEMVGRVRAIHLVDVGCPYEVLYRRSMTGQAGVIRRPFDWCVGYGAGMAGLAGHPVPLKVHAGQRVGCAPRTGDLAVR